MWSAIYQVFVCGFSLEVFEVARAQERRKCEDSDPEFISNGNFLSKNLCGFLA